MECLAAFPDLKSAITIGGGEGDCISIRLDLYGADLEYLTQLRGKQLVIKIEPDFANTPREYDESGAQEAN